jgi:hypothetical protein
VSKVRCLEFAVAIVLFSVTPASADVFSWTDGSGTVHFTDDRAGIPAKYAPGIPGKTLPQRPAVAAGG